MDKFSLSERKLSTIEVRTFERALLWVKLVGAGLFFPPDLPDFFERQRDSLIFVYFYFFLNSVNTIMCHVETVVL